MNQPFPETAKRLPIPRALYVRLFAQLQAMQAAEKELRATVTVAAETMALGEFEFLGVDDITGEPVMVVATPAAPAPVDEGEWELSGARVAT